MVHIKDFFLNYRRLFIIGLHFFFIVISYLFAFLLRFDMELPQEWRPVFLKAIPFLVVFRMAFFHHYKLYSGIWRYVSMGDIINILKAVTLGSAFFTMGILVLFMPAFPRSIIFIDWLICLLLVGGVRLLIRAFRESGQKSNGEMAKRTLIIGAGDAGERLVREINKNFSLNYKFIGFLDDDLRKQGMYIHGIQVIGKVNELPEICKEKNIKEVIVAIPSSTGKQMQRIVELSRKAEVRFKTVPSLKEIIGENKKISQVRDIELKDLLGRQEIKLDLEKIKDELYGKRIMITGAGGSIGSELARQIASFQPEILILFERAESSLYFVDLELRTKHPKIKVVAVVGDILNKRCVDEVIGRYSPDIIYHAAAYKHVPLMEENPIEAVENNVFGTENLSLSAIKAGVKKFIFISTDKAVKPVSVMGITKKISESLLIHNIQNGSTVFIAVRFGNVIGSDGSVIPLFRRQIGRGEPVTVTHPEMSRYFMLIPEAVQLVLQAGILGEGREIFLLDMGDPVKILDLAKNLITLSGLEPWKDIPIEFTGLRQGEKLHEELFSESEVVLPTVNEKIMRVKSNDFSRDKFRYDLDELRSLVTERNRGKILDKLKEMTSDLDVELGTDNGSKSRTEKELIGQVLLKAGAITRDQLEDALKYQGIWGGKIGENLVKKGYLSPLQLNHFLNGQSSMEDG